MPITVTITKPGVVDTYGRALAVGSVNVLDTDYGLALVSQLRATTTAVPSLNSPYENVFQGLVQGLSTEITAQAATLNVAAIQAALNGGGLVSILAPGTYYINATLIHPSFAVLMLGAGVWIKQLPQTNKLMWATAAYFVTPTVVVPTWSAGSLVSIPWTAHGVTTQDYVILQGATQTQYNQIFKVNTVVDANNITVLAPIAPTTSPTGTISIRKATRNFAIIGPGGFDYDYSNNGGGTGPNAFTVLIGYAANFVIEKVQSINAFKYCFNTGAVMDYSINDCYGEGAQTGSSSECLKNYGPARNGLITNLRGRTSDDFSSIQPSEDSAFLLYRWTFGNIINIRFKGVFGQNTAGTGIVSLYCDDNYTMTEICYEDIYGQISSTGGSIFSILKNQSGTNGIFGNIEVNGLYGTNEAAAGYVAQLGVSQITGDRLIIRGMTGRGQIEQLHTYSTFTCNHLQIDDTFLSVPTTASAKESISINGGTIRKLIINRLQATQTASSTAYAIAINASPTMQSLDINDCVLDGATNRRLVALTLGTTARISLRNNQQRTSGDSFLVLNQSTAVTIVADNNNSDASVIFNLGSSVGAITATLVAEKNVASANSLGFFRFNQVTNAMTVTLRTANNIITNSAHIVVPAGTPSITMFCSDIAVDPLTLTGLQTTAQQTLVSSRAGAINQGPTVRSAAGWVALGTGAAGVNTVIT